MVCARPGGVGWGAPRWARHSQLRPVSVTAVSVYRARSARKRGVSGAANERTARCIWTAGVYMVHSIYVLYDMEGCEVLCYGRALPTREPHTPPESLHASQTPFCRRQLAHWRAIHHQAPQLCIGSRRVWFGLYPQACQQKTALQRQLPTDTLSSASLPPRAFQMPHHVMLIMYCCLRRRSHTTCAQRT